MDPQNTFRILLVADTHIGLDFPLKPRVQCRRRGDDFLANFRLALEPARNGEVDAVVHGGDLFDRSRVPAALVQIALEPLLEAARAGVPVFLVPGNHERGKIPFHLWRSHPNLHIFDTPGTFVIQKGDARLSLSGFPFTRKIRDRFAGKVLETAAGRHNADVRLLCMHQAVEGAQVGPVDFTFRSGEDVIRGADLPPGFDALLSGHIHRSQVLRSDLRGRKLAAPVIYPGSVERTAFAEQHERKGYCILEFLVQQKPGSRLERIDFYPLPARPMVTLEIQPDGTAAAELREQLRPRLAELDPEAVVRIRLLDEPSEAAWKAFSAASLRELAPPTMNVTIAGGSFRGKEDAEQQKRR